MFRSKRWHLFSSMDPLFEPSISSYLLLYSKAALRLTLAEHTICPSLPKPRSISKTLCSTTAFASKKNYMRDPWIFWYFFHTYLVVPTNICDHVHWQWSYEPENIAKAVTNSHECTSVYGRYVHVVYQESWINSSYHCHSDHQKQ